MVSATIECGGSPTLNQSDEICLEYTLDKEQQE